MKKDKPNYPKAVEIIKCAEGNKKYMKERRARHPYGRTTLICEYPISPEDIYEPNATKITWRLAKRAARDFLRSSPLGSAIVTFSAITRPDCEVVIRVYGKY